MAVLLGGRAAEQLVFGKVSTGAADDLAKVYDIARSYDAQYGMVGEMGEVAYDPSALAVSSVRATDRLARTQLLRGDGTRD
jgi:ATP-dependent Zn protease